MKAIDLPCPCAGKGWMFKLVKRSGWIEKVIVRCGCGGKVKWHTLPSVIGEHPAFFL